MRLRGLSLVAFAVSTLLLIACDQVVDYTVINQSDQPVRTGFFAHACSPEHEKRLRKGPLKDSIQPGGQLHVEGVPPAKPQCVVIKSFDESTINLQPYVVSASYVVSGETVDGERLSVDIKPESAHAAVPTTAWELPKWMDRIFLILPLGGLGAAAFITARFFFRYYIRKEL